MKITPAMTLIPSFLLDEENSFFEIKNEN